MAQKRTNREQPAKKNETIASAGAAGVGGGTLVAALANSLSNQNPFKQWLILAAPSVSVLVTAIWLWLQVMILNLLHDREVMSLTASAKETLIEALNNPNTSEAHRTLIQKQLEELELLSINRKMERIKTLAIVQEADFRKQK